MTDEIKNTNLTGHKVNLINLVVLVTHVVYSVKTELVNYAAVLIVTVKAEMDFIITPNSVFTVMVVESKITTLTTVAIINLSDNVIRTNVKNIIELISIYYGLAVNVEMNDVD